MADSDIELVIDARPRDLGGFTVRRALPSMRRRLIGPFIFFDHMGPVDLPPGQGMDVRPHPHIGLATVTYLFDGELIHRDTLGSEQAIRPGDVNWMVAGRGIAHSERIAPPVRERGSRVHGIQSWVALPTRDEEADPRFEHHPAATIPRLTRGGAELHVIAGSAYGAKAPTGILSPTLYVHARLAAGATLPIDEEHEARAVYVVSGAITHEGTPYPEGALLVLRPGAHVAVQATAASDLMLIGGAPLDGTRHIFWNFVSSSDERLERAKADWRAGRFGKVHDDELEFIPLPE